MNLEHLEIPSSPAFLLDETKIKASAQILQSLSYQSGCRFLYSIKSLPLVAVLEWLKPYVDGFSVSSLFEARLASEVLAGSGSIHLTTPGLMPSELDAINQSCQFISCNSIQQFNNLNALAAPGCSLGVRVNPGLSSVNDTRYDPCRMNSKLGVSIEQLLNWPLSSQVEGLHLHSHFAGRNFTPLIEAVARLEKQLFSRFDGIKWINLGGGYLFDEIDDFTDFIALVNDLKNHYHLKVFIEPGKAIVGQAGYLYSSVIDLFDSGSKRVAVLDTSINHNPEVFEYQMSPELYAVDQNGPYAYELVGSTCLAGDLFGYYPFAKPLKIGDPIIFKNVGAYSLVKASRFNGYNLPDIYGFNGNKATLIKSYSYEDYRGQWF